MIDVSLVKQTNKKLLYSKNNVSKSLIFFLNFTAEETLQRDYRI